MDALTTGSRARLAVPAATIVCVAAAIELAGRSIARLSLVESMGGPAVGTDRLVLVAAVASAAAAIALRLARRLTPHTLVVLVLCLALPAGLAAQLRLGARLQSDGFYYFAHLRSLWFDGDQDLANDYRLLGLGDKAHLFEPTPTGYAQSAWTIGPAVVWAPFFAVGDRVARVLHARGRPAAPDGTSFPYRQAVCVAGLVWGLVGLYFCFRLAALFAPAGWAALATLLAGGGSFMLWYLVAEPSMTHAPSMAAVAVFTWGWAATRGTRAPWQWAALGLLAGFMGTIRWQNVLFALLPAIEWAMAAMALARGGAASRRPLLRHLIPGVLFTVSAVIGFLPQMLAWKAIYGHYLAVSPVGPQIRWWSPRVADILWSSRNGLFATSPILYVGAAGLLLLLRRHRAFAASALATFAAMVYFNASIQDWWGSASFGMRRFDGVVPLLVVGIAVAVEAAAALVARYPAIVASLVASTLVVWNLTYMEAAITGRAPIGEPLDFRRLAARQAETLQRWLGHPFSYPVNVLAGWRYGLSPSEYDALWVTRFLSDPTRPYGRIDVGAPDGDLRLREGWHAPERQGDLAFRWMDAEGAMGVVLDHAAPLRVQIHARPFSWPGGPPQTLLLVVNDRPFGPVAVAEGWSTTEIVVPAGAWRRGLNDVRLKPATAARPSDIGASGDTRRLSLAVSSVRFQVTP